MAGSLTVLLPSLRRLLRTADYGDNSRRGHSRGNRLPSPQRGRGAGGEGDTPQWIPPRSAVDLNPGAFDRIHPCALPLTLDPMGLEFVRCDEYRHSIPQFSIVIMRSPRARRVTAPAGTHGFIKFLFPKTSTGAQRAISRRRWRREW
jgi:hypothetical protein